MISKVTNNQPYDARTMATWIRAHAYRGSAASHIHTYTHIHRLAREMTREYFIFERISSVIVSFNNQKYPSLCRPVQSDILDDALARTRSVEKVRQWWYAEFTFANANVIISEYVQHWIYYGRRWLSNIWIHLAHNVTSWDVMRDGNSGVTLA